MKKSFKHGLFVTEAIEDDDPAISHLLAMAFGFNRQRALEYLGHAGRDALQIVRDPSGAVKAVAALLMNSHAFGGRDVPAANIAHVAIAPEARGQGVAGPLMDALCERAREQGALMVSLFASARPVYRKSGFELAGSEIVYEADTAALPTKTAQQFFPLDISDPRLATAYAEKKRVESGLLGRAKVHWRELTRQPDEAFATYGIGNAAGISLEGYIMIDASNPDMLQVRDWYAASGHIAEAILCFLGRFRSVYPKVNWHGSPQDDLVAAMPDKGWRLVHQEEWLARILEPAQALATRGYLPREGSLGIRITRTDAADIELGLAISAGRATVNEGIPAGMAAITIDEAFFASLFTGFSSASQLARRGRLSGDREAVQQCDLVFAGPRPWVAEHF